MGYRGKVVEQNRARDLRADAWTLQEIAAELGVSKSSVSLWVRDVAFTPRPRRNANYGSRDRPPNKLQRRKAAEIEELLEAGRRRVGQMTDKELLLVGAALYAGEGSKTGGEVRFANCDPRMIVLFLVWLRRFFDVDESKLRIRLYLHDGLDLDAANEFWSQITGIPVSQYRAPYRAVADPSIRRSKHPMGCPSVCLGGVRVHREVMGLVDGLLSSGALPG
jgi:transcriptional regulator with XRE-family HTH domain